MCESESENILSKQILRSGTSIGANIAESESASSKNDFINKLYIALKECSETIYWLELLNETEFISKEQFDSINADCMELYKMLMSIIKTSKNS